MAAFRVEDRRRWLVALILVGVLGVAGCDAGDPPLSIPGTLRTPEVVGVVDTVELRPGLPIIRLVGGDTYDPTGAILIVHRATLAAGSLLLAGTQPAPWYVYLEEYVPGLLCAGEPRPRRWNDGRHRRRPSPDQGARFPRPQ